MNIGGIVLLIAVIGFVVFEIINLATTLKKKKKKGKKDEKLDSTGDCVQVAEENKDKGE